MALFQGALICRAGLSQQSPPVCTLYRAFESTEQNEKMGVQHGVVLAGEHKTALFADDILVYLARPAHSLPALLEMEFGSVTAYKPNSHESQLLTFNFTTSQTCYQGSRQYEISRCADTKGPNQSSLKKL